MIEPMTQPVLEKPEPPQDECPLRIAREKNGWLDRFTEWSSEQLNPILVKETRQALKSRQFAWTFFLLLLAVVVVTLFGMTVWGNADDRMGPRLLYGYLVILGLPLGIIIPFATFRSLVSEFDDGTISLITISTLRARQIVLGKLGSTIIQMVVYLSILAPCISFTYLLRGLSVEQIGMGLFLGVSVSLLLSSLGLFLASIVRSRILSVLTSILFVILTAWLYWGWWELAYWIAMEPARDMSLAQLEGQASWFGLGVVILSSALLFLAVASSQISFAADNRSTLPRIMMIVQQTLVLAWVWCMFCLVPVHVRLITGMAFLFGHYWMLMGFLMLGESPRLSTRVRRTIPRTALGRTFLSLFLPGPGRALLFVLANVWVCIGIVFVLLAFGNAILPHLDAGLSPMRITSNPLTPAQVRLVFEASLVNGFYMTLYLCTTYLIVRWLDRLRPQPHANLVSLAIGAILVAFPAIGGLAIQYTLYPKQARQPYTAWQLGNWYWTQAESVEKAWTTHSKMFWTVALFFLIPIIAALVLASRELLQAPAQLPARVKQELEAAKKARAPQPLETIDDIFNAPRPEPSDG